LESVQRHIGVRGAHGAPAVFDRHDAGDLDNDETLWRDGHIGPKTHMITPVATLRDCIAYRMSNQGGRGQERLGVPYSV
jgi:hypothetical protein